MRRILIISPHPDDETLGAGGALLKHKNSGDKIFWINITNIKEEYGFSEKQVKNRQKEIEKMVCAYGFDDFLT